MTINGPLHIGMQMMQTMHLDYDMVSSILSHIGRPAYKHQRRYTMTLVYILIGFIGLAGAAIAKDDFANVNAPKLKISEKPLAQ